MNTTESLMSNGGLWFPAPASSLAETVDRLFYFIYYGSIAMFVVILAILFYFVLRYRRRPGREVATSQVAHNTTIEVLWTVIPLILVMIIFAWGFRDYIDMSVPPPHAKEYRVRAQKWSWTFEYPEEGLSFPNKLVVPLGEPVKLVMSSIDVIHSFYLPNFRLKRDIIPNRYTTLWFHPERIGIFHIFCSEYCGDRHSMMLAKLEVMEKEAYALWLEEEKKKSGANLPLDQLGEKLYRQYCAACHSIDGTVMVGPTWKGLYGSKRIFTDKTEAIADENYLRISTVNPAAKIVVGYANQMSAFAGLLNDREIDAIIEYIKILK